jgi:murein DD-endopeptidase MepM/ murein hydrolase activator NlpD
MPVVGASKSDYNAKSFWYYPWGKSVTHKGVDIFAEKGVRVNSATKGLVIYSGNIKYGGNVIFILGPKWRIHYYAHLEKTTVSILKRVSNQTQIGVVGSSGNAKGKQAHLHYSIATLIPYIWQIDSSRQGWKKMFYLDPIYYIEH